VAALNVWNSLPNDIRNASFQLAVLTKPISLTVSDIFNGECEAMVDMTLNDL